MDVDTMENKPTTTAQSANMQYWVFHKWRLTNLGMSMRMSKGVLTRSTEIRTRNRWHWAYTQTCPWKYEIFEKTHKNMWEMKQDKKINLWLCERMCQSQTSRQTIQDNVWMCWNKRQYSPNKNEGRKKEKNRKQKERRNVKTLPQDRHFCLNPIFVWSLNHKNVFKNENSTRCHWNFLKIIFILPLS